MTGVFFDNGVQAYLGAFTTDGANVNCEGINTASTWANYGGGIPFTMGNLDFFYFSGTYEVA
jgi:hypothetical protein